MHQLVRKCALVVTLIAAATSAYATPLRYNLTTDVLAPTADGSLAGYLEFDSSVLTPGASLVLPRFGGHFKLALGGHFDSPAYVKRHQGITTRQNITHTQARLFMYTLLTIDHAQLSLLSAKVETVVTPILYEVCLRLD